MAVPEVAAILPGVITPVPLVKTGVNVVEAPTAMDVAPAVSDVAIGPGTEPPPPLVSPPPPPPPPPHATPKAKTRPRESRRKYLRSGTKNPEIIKTRKCSKFNRNYSILNHLLCNLIDLSFQEVHDSKNFLSARVKSKDRGQRDGSDGPFQGPYSQGSFEPKATPEQIIGK